MLNNQSRELSEIETLREELGLYRFFVQDPELRQRIKEWIDSSQELTAGTQNAYLQQQLSSLRSEHPMRWIPEKTSGNECFPSDCSSCEHYGNACPLFSREVKRSRRRRLQEAQTPTQSREVWMDLHHQTGCGRIPEWLEEWREQHKPMIKEGHELLAECQDLTTDASGDMEKLPEDMRETVERDDIMSFGGGVSDA